MAAKTLDLAALTKAMQSTDKGALIKICFSTSAEEAALKSAIKDAGLQIMEQYKKGGAGYFRVIVQLDDLMSTAKTADAKVQVLTDIVKLLLSNNQPKLVLPANVKSIVP
jgi:TusA-related sulfurtransferase